jgi:hypothetical protein
LDTACQITEVKPFRCLQRLASAGIDLFDVGLGHLVLNSMFLDLLPLYL